MSVNHPLPLSIICLHKDDVTCFWNCLFIRRSEWCWEALILQLLFPGVKNCNTHTRTLVSRWRKLVRPFSTAWWLTRLNSFLSLRRRPLMFCGINALLVGGTFERLYFCHTHLSFRSAQIAAKQVAWQGSGNQSPGPALESVHAHKNVEVPSESFSTYKRSKRR